MADRSTEDVRRELASERKQLGDAIGTLRAKGAAVRRKLPFLAVGAAGASIAARLTSQRVFGRSPAGKKKRARFSFLDRD